ncbi:L,D-transpeptidase [Roseibium aggregatum]|uniref:L,D-transpeptidase n=1 Tax=Roseibium aggregatum TaxID=187304 RepID=A0A926NXH7_9HYPH|nr:L,D-transpeptidase [Roseibium aggregatum]MBD1546136.1 L,D-transpeptidase [Roseibium aggregatum]
MYRFIPLAVLIALAPVCEPALAGNIGRTAAPPLVLSPNLTEPWILQLRPQGQRRQVQQPRTGNWLFGSRPQTAARRQTASVQTAARRPQRQIEPQFLPAIVEYDGPYKPGTIIINTEERYLYLVQRDGTARRYGVGVGKPGFEWAGTHKITRKAEWPDWRPPKEMLQRRPDLPTFMEGGPRNPLGARALYLGSTLYRIHGSNQPWTIGHAVSSGCIRMRNQDVEDLYERVGVGTEVHVI